MSRLQTLQQAYKAANQELPNEPPNQVALKCPIAHSEQYHFKDEHTDQPIEGLLYCAETADGQRTVGRTDRHGNTLRIYTQAPEQLTLRWGKEAAAHLRKQGITF